MAKIAAFKGITYNVKNTNDPSKVVAPPYDVISDDQKKKLYKKSQHNVVRLILNDEAAKRKGIEKYKIVKDLLQTWEKKEILVQDANPHIYVCAEEYSIGNEKKVRYGFFARVQLEDFSNKKVLPHERIIDHHMEDRLDLLREVKTNLSPVFSVFNDSEKKIALFLRTISKKKKPYFHVSYDTTNVKLWKISDQMIIKEIIQMMRPKKLFIADGHHRYQAALHFKNQMNNGEKKNDLPHNYVLMYLVSSDDPGLTILPTHRVVEKLPKCNEKHIIATLSQYFEMTQVKNKKTLVDTMKANESLPGVFGFCTADNNMYVLQVTKKTLKEMKQYFPNGLDVEILHDFIFNHLLGWEGKIQYTKNLFYISDNKKVFEEVTSKKGKIAFFLNSTKMDQIKKVALKGRRMPQKSTFFYPKVLTGLVFNPLENLEKK